MQISPLTVFVLCDRFFLPVSLVICNDIWAYIFGKVLASFIKYAIFY